MDIYEKRKFELFKLVKDCSFGTLWWVSNVIWSRNRKLQFKKLSGKHPGVSLAHAVPGENPYTIPMLFGTSREQATALVADMGDRKGRKTYFIRLRPVNLGFKDFFGTTTVKEASPKSRLDDEEIGRLRAFIREKLK